MQSNDWEYPTACDYCGVFLPKTTLVVNAHGSAHDLVECVCGLRFYSPRRSLEWVAAQFEAGSWSPEADLCLEKGVLAVRPEILEPEAQKRLLREFALSRYQNACKLAGFVPSATTRLYEVGASIGWFLKACIDQGIADPRRSGMCDQNPRACILASTSLKLGNVSCGAFLDVSPEPAPFDVFVANDYVEHTYTPHADLGKMRSLAAPGAAIYIKTFLDEMDEPRGRQYLMPPWHAYHWTRATLRRALETEGWRITSWDEEPLWAQVAVYGVAV